MRVSNEIVPLSITWPLGQLMLYFPIGHILLYSKNVLAAGDTPIIKKSARKKADH